MARTGDRGRHSVLACTLRTLLPAAAAAVLVAAPAHAAQVSTTYTTVGESAFTVPAGVHAIDVSLTGARGGAHFDSTRAAAVRWCAARWPVTPGERLYAVVGGAGTNFSGGAARPESAGGANGGGSGYPGGGGASDIRTEPPSPRRPRSQAGCGRRRGRRSRPMAERPGATRARPVAPAAVRPSSGSPARNRSGGAGGTATPGGENGTAGTLGHGGDGMAPSFRGGGGGGGLLRRRRRRRRGGLQSVRVRAAAVAAARRSCRPAGRSASPR